MNDKPRDNIYATPQSMIVDFAFDEKVAGVFPDMIRRSVPGYETVITLLGLLAEGYAQPDSRIYDFGSSLGAATLSMRNRVAHDSCRIIAVDNSTAMTERCRQILAQDDSPVEVDVICADIRDIKVERASLVVLNFTLQFIPADERQALLDHIYAGLLPGSALVLSEKLAFEKNSEQQFQTDMHLAFKKANGYSELEISQKRTALEKVLIPDSFETHRKRLQQAGFKDVYQWFQCFNFVSLLAVK
ncbi:carboxy-S-adenosyl-L-methionine synthase CmoA [Thiohalophilus thiocyanatoxydans]|uniref:Carboxy-S-adenosyl-L-methionine synthase n=1 Tax=Thiohalophilus thiocyanatoxydans TaxID=381308 RepID=A0A4R8IPQ3_9GAMM|nr:carboxy-S-adenosyl-L-methionine synthase CmoA [Thiohalophilus thiocyanatoxydans]TDX98171.1 tRNA (cmo5U34)-methyltransferase [Thiohalophilus thiocyanatoxydans]